MAVVEGELLLAVGRIIGRVHVDRDPPRLSAQAPAVMLQHRVGERVGHAEQIRSPNAILEARERGLRGQGLARDRVPARQQLVHGIVRDARRVVPVRVAAGDAEGPLPQQLLDLVSDLARLTPVIQAGGQPLREAELLVDGLEQQRTAVRAAVLLVELRDHGLAREELREQDRLCGRVVAHEGLWVCAKLALQPVSSASEAFVLSTFVNFPG